MVPGQKTQATGIKRQGSTQPLLQRGIGDGEALSGRDFFHNPADVRVHLTAEFGQDRVIMAQIFGVAGHPICRNLHKKVDNLSILRFIVASAFD